MSLFQSLTWRMSVCLREGTGVRLQLLPRRLLRPTTIHLEVLHPSRLPYSADSPIHPTIPQGLTQSCLHHRLPAFPTCSH